VASTSPYAKKITVRGQANNVVLDLETRARKAITKPCVCGCASYHARCASKTKFGSVWTRVQHHFARFDLMASWSANRRTAHERAFERLMVSGGNVTGITDQLEREGLVSRTPCPGDSPRVYRQLTGTGLKRFSVKWPPQHELWIIELLEGLSRGEKETMITELGKVKAHITGRLRRR